MKFTHSRNTTCERSTCSDKDSDFFHLTEMGCSPSHAVIINQSPTQETICLQPRIYMVSESTLCLLREVGELRVYHVDERNPETAVERFRGAQDQLSNPLSFHPQLRSARRERLNTVDFQSAGSSSLTSEQENVRVRIEVARDEEHCDDVDEAHSDTSADNICDNDAMQRDAVPESQNAHSVTVEVYSYKQNSDGLQEENDRKNNFGEVENNSEPQNVENDAALVAVAATQQNEQTSDEQGEPREINDEEAITISDEPKDATLAWSETVDKGAEERAESRSNQNSEIDHAVFTRNTSETGKETVKQEIELLEHIDL